MMNVGQAAEASGMSVKTLHYYEEIGLVVPKRQENGYRAYSETDVHKLNFIHRAAFRQIEQLSVRVVPSMPRLVMRRCG